MVAPTLLEGTNLLKKGDVVPGVPLLCIRVVIEGLLPRLLNNRLFEDKRAS